MAEMVIRNETDAVFFSLSFDGRTPQGKVRFHEAFQADRPASGEAE